MSVDGEELPVGRSVRVELTHPKNGTTLQIPAKVVRHIQGDGVVPAIALGTWAAASWAIDFYRRNGYTVVPSKSKDRLLRTYWSIPARQVETSVVLADRRWMEVRKRAST